MYKEASKLKLRFESKAGMLTVEDLWDLPLTSNRGPCLDEVAKSAYQALSEFEVTFVGDVSVKNREAKLRLDIVKDVIADKLAERERAKQEKLLKAKKEKIMSIIAEKEFDELKGKDISQLQSMLHSL